MKGFTFEMILLSRASWRKDAISFTPLGNYLLLVDYTARLFRGTETSRVTPGGCPPRVPTDPDLPVDEASGSSSYVATPLTMPWTTRARGRL